MPKQKHSDNSQSEILSEQQKRTLLVTACLQTIALPSVFNRELTEQDYDLWQNLLTPYPLKAIEYAFDNWGRNGKSFPKPANILELIGVWSISNKEEFVSCGQCEEGWVFLREGKTDGGHLLKPPNRMVKRCQCFINWVNQRKQRRAA